MSPSISDWISMILDLVKICGVLSSNMELSVCTKTCRVWIVETVSSRECPTVSVDCHRLCLARFLILSNVSFFYDTDSWISKDTNNMMSKCVASSPASIHYGVVYSAVLILHLCLRKHCQNAMVQCWPLLKEVGIDHLFSTNCCLSVPYLG